MWRVRLACFDLDMCAQPATDKWTIVYDGSCDFCKAQVERIRRVDRNRAFEFVPRQTEGLTDRFPVLAEGDFNTGMRLVSPGGDHVYVGADAVYQIARRVPRWRTLAWLYRVPGLHAMFRAGYAVTAANRHMLAGPCRTGACSIHEEDAPQPSGRSAE